VEPRIKELLAQRDDIDTELATLGHSAPAAGSRKIRKTPLGEKQCKICEIKGHDARAHRSQDPKKPFTRAELDDLVAVGRHIDVD